MFVFIFLCFWLHLHDQSLRTFQKSGGLAGLVTVEKCFHSYYTISLFRCSRLVDCILNFEVFLLFERL